MKKPPIQYWAVPRIWPGTTVVILAGGPSRTAEVVETVRRARFGEGGRNSEVSSRAGIKVIAINRAFEAAPWADLLYICDHRCWEWFPAAYRFAQLKICLNDDTPRKDPSVLALRQGFADGLALDNTTLNTGQNGTHQAINLAWHLAGPGARVLLTGVDMRQVDGKWHCHPEYPNKSWSGAETAAFLRRFPALAADCAREGLHVVNVTPGSALTCFPLGDLEKELARACGLSDTVAA